MLSMKKLFFLIFLISCFSISGLSAGKISLEKEMAKKVRSLGKEKSYDFIDLRLTPDELDLLNRIKFEENYTELRWVDFFLDSNDVEDLSFHWVETSTPEDHEANEKISKLLSRIIKQVIKASKKNSVIIALRYGTLYGENDLPDWHMEHILQKSNGSPRSLKPICKFATTLCGSSPLYYNPTRSDRKYLKAPSHSKEFLNSLIDTRKAQSPRIGEGCFYIVGNEDAAALVSESNGCQNKLQLFIITADASEIDEIWSQM